MHGDFPVVLDACVLANGRLCDLYLRLAEPPRLYLPLWSNVILDEVRRVQTEKLKRPYPEDLADYWRAEVENAFPEASVQGWEAFLPMATNDEKDRHVLAAALASNATVIVTFNIRHFSPKDLAPHGVEAQEPQDHLLTLWAIQPEVVTGKLAQMAEKRGEELQDVLIALGKSVPRFSTHVINALGLSGQTN